DGTRWTSCRRRRARARPSRDADPGGRSGGAAYVRGAVPTDRGVCRPQVSRETHRLRKTRGIVDAWYCAQERTVRTRNWMVRFFFLGNASELTRSSHDERDERRDPAQQDGQ